MSVSFLCAVIVVEMCDGGTRLSVHSNEFGSYPRYKLDVF